MQYGERLQSAPLVAAIRTAGGSLLSDSGLDVEADTDSDCTPYASTVINESGARPASVVAPGAEALQLEPGTVLTGRYRVVRRVGSGGFGTAVLIEDMVVNEEIILQFLHASMTSSP
jgi:serine/threonine-protein kinase